MQIKWTAGLPPEKQEEMRDLVKRSFPLRERLMQIIQLEIEQAERQQRSDDYDSPSWGYKQADLNGVLRTLHKINELLKG